MAHPFERNPEEILNNVGYLKAINQNSADNVRQVIKRVIARNIAAKQKFAAAAQKGPVIAPDQNTSADLNNMTQQTNCDPDKQTEELIKQIVTKPLMSNDIQNQIRENILQRAQNRQIPVGSPKKTRKRPGRPPKAGPSRKIRRISITNFYIGKLSNLVHFRYNDSDSD